MTTRPAAILGRRACVTSGPFISGSQPQPRGGGPLGSEAGRRRFSLTFLPPASSPPPASAGLSPAQRAAAGGCAPGTTGPRRPGARRGDEKLRPAGGTGLNRGLQPGRERGFEPSTRAVAPYLAPHRSPKFLKGRRWEEQKSPFFSFRKEEIEVWRGMEAQSRQESAPDPQVVPLPSHCC